jgi:hypothetical protein
MGIFRHPSSRRNPARLDLPARHEAEEQDDGGAFARQRALRFHPAPRITRRP